jgi:hypothetical protein
LGECYSRIILPKPINSFGMKISSLQKKIYMKSPKFQLLAAQRHCLKRIKKNLSKQFPRPTGEPTYITQESVSVGMDNGDHSDNLTAIQQVNIIVDRTKNE